MKFINFFIKSRKKEKICEGCKQKIKMNSKCVIISTSWRDSGTIRIFFHNKKCFNIFDKKRKLK